MNQFSQGHIEVFPIVIPVSNTLKSVNFYLVKQGRRLSLIDAGFNNEECWQALQTVLQHNGFQLRDLTEILLTHHHVDHVGLVDRIVAEHSVPVYAHARSVVRLKRDETFLKMRAEFFKRLYEEMGCGELGSKQVENMWNAMKRNKGLKIQSEIITLPEHSILDFEIIEIPGHAHDQVAFYHRESKWLLAGDLLMEHLSPLAFVEPDFNGNRMKTLVQHIESLQKCLPLQTTSVFSGHGGIIKDSDSLIEKRLNRIEEKANQFLSLIAVGVSTAHDIARMIHKEKYEKQFYNIITDVIGYLDYLEEQGKIQKKSVRGVYHYYVN